jgi:hypothetical protein
MFPPVVQINTVELEKEYQNIKLENGDFIKQLSYNRGM